MTIKALFIDIGGVILTNGWDHQARELAAQTFHLDLKELESRHRLTFDTYEIGKITLETYLDRIVFYEPRSFSQKDFQEFMFEQSHSYPEMIELIRSIKQKYNLKVAVISNEGRELTEYRIKQFKLGSFVDFFTSSCFVGLKKPDFEIFKLALDLAQVEKGEVAYIDDRLMFVEVANRVGMQGVHHTDINTTVQLLNKMGLKT